jgi:hypothetical protein
VIGPSSSSYQEVIGFHLVTVLEPSARVRQTANLAFSRFFSSTDPKEKSVVFLFLAFGFAALPANHDGTLLSYLPLSFLLFMYI